MEDKQKHIDAVLKVLGEPVICEFDSKTQKIRTTLFLLSVISITYALGDLKVDPTSSFLGLKFSGLNDQLFRYGLLGSIAYLTMHFTWCASDNFMEWRLRITGTKASFITAGTFASADADYPSDPRQSTLYNWWRGQAVSISGISNKLETFDAELQTIKTVIDKHHKDELNIHTVNSSLSQAQTSLAKVQSHLSTIEGTLESNRVPASLERFDNWFKIFLKSQNIRWFIIEFLMPIALAVSAFCLLSCFPQLKN